MGNRVWQLVCAYRSMLGVFGNALRMKCGAEAFNLDVMRLSGWVGWTGVMVWTAYADNESLSIYDGIDSGFLALGDMTGEGVYG
jgi:hypothetical protein